MGYQFGKKSAERLAQCDYRLQEVAAEAILTSPVDFSITCGHRGQEEQDRCCREGLSKAPWPTSKHNKIPSQAFDFVPFRDGKPCWDDLELFRDVAHHILGIADRKGIDLRWGGTWSDNAEDRLAKFADCPHMELK